MTPEQLRAIVAKMTPRPWETSDPPEYITSSDGLIGDTYNGHSEDRGNSTGIVALANHGDALVELYEALERHLTEGGGLPPDVMSALLKLERIP